MIVLTPELLKRMWCFSAARPSGHRAAPRGPSAPGSGRSFGCATPAERGRRPQGLGFEVETVSQAMFVGFEGLPSVPAMGLVGVLCQFVLLSRGSPN